MSLILSASGWRKVFAASGLEEDDTPQVSNDDRRLVRLMADCFGYWLLARTSGRPTIAVGTDTRPTGPILAQTMIQAFQDLDIAVHYLGITAAPEIMAYARLEPKTTAFCYLSASHNPIGHNGVKFGLNNGSVLGGAEAQALIDLFKNRQSAMSPASSSDPPPPLARTLPSAKWKAKALDHYRAFTQTVIFDTADEGAQTTAWTELRSAFKARGFGVVAELNGSARTLTIDQTFLTDLGLKVRVVNGLPGQIAHRIVPEGRSLDQAKQVLAQAHQTDPGFTLAYVPDNDGDRGNIVYFDEASNQALALEAQTVFALCVVSELSWLVYQDRLTYSSEGRAHQKVAVVVNDPTSLRIEAIAQAFDAEVFRAEVGEANVVNLAALLHKKGYLVRILGEGSNGGNITHPSAVRDPIHTLVAILRLMAIRDLPGRPSPFTIWCQRINQPRPKNAGLSEILGSLPAWITTSAYEDRALLKIATTDHGRLKERYEAIFKRDWEAKKADLGKRLGFMVWEEINYEGTEARHGFGPRFRSGQQRGGFQILFKDDQGRAKGYLWMRGSGTEPVFRVAVDLPGDRPAEEAELLVWHCAMIAEADRG